MKKIRVNANAIVDDIRMGLDLKSLMEKHGLSYRNLLKVLGRLQEKGWITREDLGHLNLAEGSEQSSVPAKEFLVSFRSRPDDFHLMDTFRLTPKALRKTYKSSSKQDCCRNTSIIAEIEKLPNWKSILSIMSLKLPQR